MSTETLNNNLNKNISVKKVNVDVLKSRVIEKKKKKKTQNRIILGSFIISMGVIGYLIT